MRLCEVWVSVEQGKSHSLGDVGQGKVHTEVSGRGPESQGTKKLLQ